MKQKLIAFGNMLLFRGCHRQKAVFLPQLLPRLKHLYTTCMKGWEGICAWESVIEKLITHKKGESVWLKQQLSPTNEPRKKPPSFHCTGCFKGILIIKWFVTIPT